MLINTTRHLRCRSLAALIVLLGAVGAAPPAQGQSDAERNTIESDWKQQESVIRGLDHATPEALDGVLGRARTLVASVRELSLENPLLDFDELLFVRRHWP